MRPAVAALFSFFFVVAITSEAANASINTRSSKYAAFVIDVDTNEVLYSRNGDAKRYPASLTKMMTMYLLFEALDTGEISMNQKMHVSGRAASQPQTNISLDKGDRISVRDAMKALVVRSANDVAVVVAEALAGSEWRFAQQMTKKARELGMHSTVFRNPHGLPDKKQHTTARDMARLSIALRRDYPHYYDIFETKRFTWNGKTYKSHNRVMKRYGGVDGIKTGYINMSGFNLATSIKRDGYNLVAIVMGGRTGRIRDNHMIGLLDQTFTRLAKRGDRPRLIANAPVPVPKPVSLAADEAPAAEMAAMGMGDRVEIPSITSSAHAATGQEVVARSAKHRAAADEAPEAPPMTLQYQMAKLQASKSGAQALRPHDAAEAWGIQVGAYSDKRTALNAAAHAIDIAGEHLKHSRVLVTGNNSTRRSIHRARLANLSEYQAKRACQRLVAENTQCFVYKADGQRKL